MITRGASPSYEWVFVFGWAFGPLIGCGEGTSGAPSSWASAPPPKRCSDDLTQDERLRRCQDGEALCCAAMIRGVPKEAPDYFDRLALACRTGDVSSCEVVRDSDRDATYKLDALAQGCTRIGRWPCRTAAMLAVLVAPERAPAVIENYCRQTDDKTFRIAEVSLECKKIDAAALAPLAPHAEACRGGDLEACRTLAGVDGGARRLYDDVAWVARGVPRADAEKSRLPRLPLGDTEPKGRVGVTATAGSDADRKAAEAALKDQADPLRRCVAAAVEGGDPVGGSLRLALAIDRSGRVATTRVVGKELEGGTLSPCLRAELQDLHVGAPGTDVRSIEVVLHPSR